VFEKLFEDAGKIKEKRIVNRIMTQVK
jgi:hypothetical protein